MKPALFGTQMTFPPCGPRDNGQRAGDHPDVSRDQGPSADVRRGESVICDHHQATAHLHVQIGIMVFKIIIL